LPREGTATKLTEKESFITLTLGGRHFWILFRHGKLEGTTTLSTTTPTINITTVSLTTFSRAALSKTITIKRLNIMLIIGKLSRNLLSIVFTLSVIIKFVA